MSVFISTGAFRTRNIREILDLADAYDIRNIEVSPGLDYRDDIIDIINQATDRFTFLIHNYFPPQKAGFALNLASADSVIWQQSMDMCRNNIDYAVQWKIPFYSVHCGFCFDTDGTALGNSSQVNLPRISYEEARRRFIDSIRTLCDYASEKNILIAIENNVVADFAKIYRSLYLGVTADDLLDIIRAVDRPNLRVLLDLAHAKVSCCSLGLKLSDMITSLNGLVAELHLSHNDGKRDQNLPLDDQCDLFRYLSGFHNIPITLEVYDLSLEEIKEQIKLTEGKLIEG